MKKEERWFVAEADALREPKGTRFGEQEIAELWTRKGWRSTPRQERYLVQCKRLLDEGAISVASRWSTCSFDPVYQTLHAVTLLDVAIDRGHELHFDMDEHKDELAIGTPWFRRTAGYEEEHDEGHADDKAER